MVDNAGSKADVFRRVGVIAAVTLHDFDETLTYRRAMVRRDHVFQNAEPADLHLEQKLFELRIPRGQVILSSLVTLFETGLSETETRRDRRRSVRTVGEQACRRRMKKRPRKGYG